MKCYCYLRNIQDLLSDGKSPCERWFGIPFDGPFIQFGAVVEHHPISAQHLSRLNQFGAKVFPGIFLGYALHAGRNLEGDIMVADVEELKNWERWTRLKSTWNDSMQRKCQRPWVLKSFNSQSQMEQWNSLVESRFWEHPPHSGITQTEEKDKIIFKEKQTDLLQPTSRLFVVWWWS